MPTVVRGSVFTVGDVEAGVFHTIHTDTTREEADIFHIFNQVLTDTLGGNIWHAGVTCDEMDDGLPHFNPCGVVGGCCFGDGPTCWNTHGCLPHREDVCDRGWRLGRAHLSYTTPGGTRQIFEEGCAFRKPLNVACWEITATKYTGDTTLCQCSFTTSPFIAEELLAVGFDSCVLMPQDERSWEEGCGDIEVPVDLPCFTLGMPLVIDEEGFAAFDAGNKRVDSDAEGCAHVLADLYVDSGGFARSLACTKFDDQGNATRIAIGDFYQEQCAAMYNDYRYDPTFGC